MPHLVLQAGASYDLSISAASGNGIGPLASQTVSLGNPQIFIGDPSNGMVVSPPATQAFAAWDSDNDGILRDAQGSGGVFPLFQSTNGGNPVVEAGNRLDKIGQIQANVVVGYYFYLNDSLQFVAFHLFIDPVSNQATQIRVLYGDAQPGVSGTVVWVTSPGVIMFNAQITEGNTNPLSLSPNIVKGRVTAPTVSQVTGTTRVIEFTFNLALLQN